jgi:phage-related protein
VQFVLYALAAVGLFALLVVVKVQMSARRMHRVGNAFMETSYEALRALQEQPGDQIRQYAALAAWERSREALRALPPKEQKEVVAMMHGVGFAGGDITRTITALVEDADRRHAGLNRDLDEIMSAAGTRP